MAGGGGGLYLAALGIVRKVALAGKPSGGEWLPRVGVLRALQKEDRGAGVLTGYRSSQDTEAQPRPLPSRPDPLLSSSDEIHRCLSPVLPLGGPV